MGQQDLFKHQQDVFQPHQAREERLEREPSVLSRVTHRGGMADTAATGRTRQSSCRFLVPEPGSVTEFTGV